MADVQSMVQQIVDLLRRKEVHAPDRYPREGLTDAERELVDYLEPLLPPLVARTAIPQWVGGLKRDHLANLDCSGKGVRAIFTIGESVFYLRRDVIGFLLSRGVKRKFSDPLAAQAAGRTTSRRPAA